MTLWCILQIMVLENSGRSCWIFCKCICWEDYDYADEEMNWNKVWNCAIALIYIYFYINQLIKTALPNILVLVTPMYILVQYFLINGLPNSWIIFDNKHTFTKQFNSNCIQHWCITLMQSSYVFLLPGSAATVLNLADCLLQYMIEQLHKHQVSCLQWKTQYLWRKFIILNICLVVLLHNIFH